MLTFNGIIQIIMGGIGSVGFSILYHIRGAKILLAGLGGVISWGLFLLLEGVLPSEALRYFISSAVIGIYSEVLARVQKTPTTTYIVPSIIPLVPGGSLYNTMKFAVSNDWNACLSKAFDTFILALALALGVIFISSFFRMGTAIMWHIKNKKL